MTLQTLLSILYKLLNYVYGMNKPHVVFILTCPHQKSKSQIIDLKMEKEEKTN